MTAARTENLALLIQQAVAQLKERSKDHDDEAQAEGLLFLGHWHDAYPRLLFHDPVLEPVDKVVWAVIRHHANLGQPTAFPTYQQIARLANVRSNATVARAIMILRVTRWVSLCARVRDEQGCYRGHVYALHDEPITVDDAVSLDCDYLGLLQELCNHHHDRVRRVTLSVLNTIEESKASGNTVSHVNRLAEQVERRLSALGVAAGKPSARRFYSVSARQLQRLRAEDDSRVQNLNTGEMSRVQILNMESKSHEKQSLDSQHQNLNTAQCSSCLYKKTTTTTNGAFANSSTDPDTATESGLHFPPQLRSDEIALARKHLANAPDASHQDLLDELQGRLSSAGEPIRNPIGYLARLCNAAQHGEFQVTSLGLQIREARKRTEALARSEAQQQAIVARQARSGASPRHPLAERIEQIRAQRRSDAPKIRGGARCTPPANRHRIIKTGSESE